jgi:hypothetical protein
LVNLQEKGVLESVENLNRDALVKYIYAIQGGYRNISYHNKTHATDVC